MAKWWDEYTWEAYNYFGETELELYRDFIDLDQRLDSDEFAHSLYHSAMFDFDLSPMDRDMVYQALIEYMAEEYGLDFAQEFDWESYREWYEAA